MQVRRGAVPLTPDEKEFLDRFFNANRALMAHFATRICFAESLREDLIQDVAERLMRQVATLRAIEHEPGKVAYYIHAATQSAFIDRYRSSGSSAVETVSTEELDALLTTRMVARQAPFEDAYWDVQQLRQKLPERDWRLLEGKYIIGFSDEELGKALGIKKSNIRMAISRAKKRAKAILFTQEEGGSDHAAQDKG